MLPAKRETREVAWRGEPLAITGDARLDGALWRLSTVLAEIAASGCAGSERERLPGATDTQEEKTG